MERNKAPVLLRQFNETIEKWIAALDNYTLQALCRQPQAGSWSLGQVYRHIIDDSGYYVGQLKEALSTTANSEGEMTEQGKALFRANGFPDSLIDGPSTGVAIPQPRSKDELWQGLTAIKNAVNALFAGFDPSAAAGKTEHPGFRFLNALEWLQFAEMHMRHHFRQKKRIDGKLQ